MTLITMPQLGETIVEGTILKWLKNVGDQVARDEPLFEISTDKVDTEVPSPVAGTVVKVLVDEGATVPVGTVVMEVEDAASGAATEAPAPAGDAAPAPAAEEAAPAKEAAPAETPGSEAPIQPAEATTAEATAPTAAAPPATVAASSSTLPDRGPRSQILSPLVRRLAAEHDLDLSAISGTGTGGRITKSDVLAAVETREGRGAHPSEPAAQPGAVASPATAAPPAVAPAQPAPTPPVAEPPLAAAASAVPSAGEMAEPISHIRKSIATHMVASVQTTARAWTMVEVNVDHLVELRTRAKEAFKAKHGVNLTYLPFVVRGTVDALQTYPTVNARLDGDQIITSGSVHMGIAVSYDAGLIVPVIKNADVMNTVGIARAIADLAARARAHQLKPDEVQGATFTITNPGPYGSVASVPIINLPNVGILSLDAIVKRPVVVDDAIAIRSMVNISMSWDHRVIDGEIATRFLAKVKQNLESWTFAEDLGV